MQTEEFGLMAFSKQFVFAAKVCVFEVLNAVEFPSSVLWDCAGTLKEVKATTYTKIQCLGNQHPISNFASRPTTSQLVGLCFALVFF